MNGKVKAVFYLCIAICLLLSLSGPAAAGPGDVQGHWAEGTINEWLDKGMASGFPDGSFKPNQPVTRAEFITMVNNAFGFIDTAEVNFKDVSPADWFYKEVAKAVKAGYISGYDDGTLRPNQPISREEAAVILCRVLDLTPEENPAVLQAFQDSGNISDWAKGYVATLVGKQIMGGYPDSTFRSRSPITRAEAIVANNNALKSLSAEPVTVVPEPSVAVPAGRGGGGGGGHGHGGYSPAVIESATLTISGTDYPVDVESNGLNGSIDLSGLSGSSLLTAGSIDVSKDSTLSLTFDILPFTDRTLRITQTLDEGENVLDVIDYLEALEPAGNGVSLTELYDIFDGEITFEGELSDGTVTKEVTLMVKLPSH